jgi:hypothetical protein
VKKDADHFISCITVSKNDLLCGKKHRYHFTMMFCNRAYTHQQQSPKEQLKVRENTKDFLIKNNELKMPVQQNKIFYLLLKPEQQN